jgi:tetratricopeptide (TPR) repeat protein
MGASRIGTPANKLTRPRPRDSTTFRLLTRIVQACLALILVVAPFPFGSVQDQWVFAMEMAICLLLLLWIGIQISVGEVAFVKARLTHPLVALGIFLVLSLGPMPRALLSLLSPEASRLYEAAIKTVAEAGAGTNPVFRLTLTPFDTQGQLLRFISYIFFFQLALSALRYRSAFVAVYRSMIASGTAVAFLGIVQDLWSNGLIYWRYDSGSGMPFGPFVNHNNFAGYILLCLGLSLGMLAAEIRRGARSRNARCWPLAAAAAAMLTALIASLSRSGLVSLLVGSCIFAAFLFLGVMRPGEARPAGAEKVRRRAAGITLGLVGLLAVFLVFSPRIRGRWSTIVDASAHYRLAMLSDGLKALSDFPVSGSGLGSFRSTYPRYKSSTFQSESIHAENEYLEWAIETGLIGLFLLGLVLWRFAAQVLSGLLDRKDPYDRSLCYGALFSLTCICVQSLADFGLHIPSNALTLVAIGALSLIIVNHRGGEHGEQYLVTVHSVPLRRLKGVAALSSAGLLALCFGVQCWRHYQSRRLTAQWTAAKPFMERRDPDERSFALLTEASRWAPWNDHTHYLQAIGYESAAAGKGLFQFLEKQRLLDHAQGEILEAIRLRPVEARYWAALGRIEQGLTHPQISERAFRQAISLASGDGLIQRDYGFFLLLEGNVRGAASRFVAARTYYPYLDLRPMLDAMGSRTDDPRLWRSIVRNQPQDLRVYADFLESRGLTGLGNEVRLEAEALEQRR